MRKAEKHDRSLIIEILAKSFDHNKSVNDIVQQDQYREKRVRYLMEYSFEICSMFGEVWLSDDDNACALIIHPHIKKTKLRGIIFDIKLLVQVVGIKGIKKVLSRESKVKQRQPNIPMAYLWFIGVNPPMQKHGVGSILLNEIILHSETLGLAVFLETSNINILPWYQKQGFNIYDELYLDYKLYFLKKNINFTCS